MRILIAGIDGYIGWPLAHYLLNRGHEVFGIDNFNRRKWVKKIGGISAIDIVPMEERLMKENVDIDFLEGDVRDYDFVCRVLGRWMPDAIVHLAEMPSAPYSMMGIKECIETHDNNVNGTLNILHAMREYCPYTHLVKLGTMGEYGTPNVDIPEGVFELEFRGRKDTCMFPRKAGSWYHQTKVHDTNNVEFACRVWGLGSTDIMQGVVYGTDYEYYNPKTCCEYVAPTRFDFDEIFGTAINRFCACAVIGEPLPVYDRGTMKRGFLPLQDSLQCLGLAVENPAFDGEYRTWNQFDECYTIMELAEKVAWLYHKEFKKPAIINCYENPRVEELKHHYNPDREKLVELGYKPCKNTDEIITKMLYRLKANSNRISAYKRVIKPRTRWETDVCTSTMKVLDSIVIGE